MQKLKKYIPLLRNNLGPFDNGSNFLSYLKDNGVKRGVYKVKVGKHIFILQFLKNLNSGIDIFNNLNKLVGSPEKDISEVLGGQILCNYNVLKYNLNKKVIDDFIEFERLSIKGSKSFKNGIDFLIDVLLPESPYIAYDGVWRIKVGEVYFVIDFYKLY